jgi:hypothetical protein
MPAFKPGIAGNNVSQALESLWMTNVHSTLVFLHLPGRCAHVENSFLRLPTDAMVLHMGAM